MVEAATIGKLVDDLGRDQGERVAIVTSGGRRVSFGELAALSDRTAFALASIGVSAGSRVGILMPNRPEWLACAVGAWKLGAVVVPLNTLLRLGELEYALRHADVSVLIAVNRFLRHDYAAMLAELCSDVSRSSSGLVRHSRRLPCLRRIVLAGEATLPGAIPFDQWLPTENEDRGWLAAASGRVSDCEDAAIFFTSGSTAAPKGVVHTHATMLTAACNVADRLGLDHEDRTWGYLPFFFNGGLVAVALATLSCGAALLTQEVFEPGDALKLMREESCTVLFAWPHQAYALINHPDFDRAQLRIRKGPGANAPWAGQLLPPDHQAVGTWGMTETGPMACSTRFDDPMPVRAGSHGRPMPGLEIRIADPDTGAPLSEGAEGEIVVRGSSVMRGYYKMDQRDCFDRDGFFHTGDLGRADGTGRLHFIGRIKDVIKTAGVNVAAAEIEATLASHPRVRLAWVTGVPDAERGEDVVAFMVPRDSAMTADDLLEFCRARLASYKVPRHVFLCEEDDVPVLGSGKVDKQRLRQMALERIRVSASAART